MKRYQKNNAQKLRNITSLHSSSGNSSITCNIRIFVARFHEDISNLHDMLK